MFPNNYSFNPGMVLDPNTMTPMISATSFTVNPFGVPAKPEQKVWQKMFLKCIPAECSNDNLLKLLKQFGDVKNFKRMNDSRGSLLAFCHFDLETGEQILRIRRLFTKMGDRIKILDKTLQLKISNQTESFIKQWMSIQRDQWRKKLLAPAMNEAKQFNTIEDYHEREDWKYKQKIEDRLKQINVQVKKAYFQKLREEQKREHPREKQREKKKKKMDDQLQRNYRQQEQYLLKRERNKQKQYRRQRDKQKERERSKVRRLDKELEMTQQEEERKINKYLNPERMKYVQQQEIEDLIAIEQEHPPEPQQQLVDQNKKKRTYIGEQIKISKDQFNKLSKNPEVALEIQEQQIDGKEKIAKAKPHRAFQQSSDSGSDDSIDEQPLELKLPDIPVQTQKNNSANDILPQQLQAQIPQNKLQLYQYQINWQKLSQSVSLQRNIRPFLEQCSYQYMGSVEQKFIALVQKKLFSCSHPDKIIKIMRQLIDDDAEQFVFRLWRKLVEEDLKIKYGLL